MYSPSVIHEKWEKAPFIHIDPDCPYLCLEEPYNVGPFVSIGGFGFGYYRDEKGWRKPKPHDHGVIIREGAAFHPGVTVDRGSWRDTVIGKNSRLNTRTFVGHNVQIGDGVLIGVKSTVSGSTNIGDLVVIWNHVFIEQRCEVKNGSIIGAFSHVRKNTIVEEREVWWGNPAKFQRMRRENE